MKFKTEYCESLHSHGVSVIHAYFTGDDDHGTDDVRLSLISATMQFNLDMPPTQMLKLAQMIIEALEEEGFK